MTTVCPVWLMTFGTDRKKVLPFLCFISTIASVFVIVLVHLTLDKSPNIKKFLSFMKKRCITYRKFI